MTSPCVIQHALIIVFLEDFIKSLSSRERFNKVKVGINTPMSDNNYKSIINFAYIAICKILASLYHRNGEQQIIIRIIIYDDFLIRAIYRELLNHVICSRQFQV